MKHPIMETDLGCFTYEIHPQVGVLMHADVYKWSKESFLEMLGLYRAFLNELKQHGITYVCAAVPEDDVKLQKFCRMMGFQESEHGLLLDQDYYCVWAMSTE